jgi:hypothetical protein
LITGELKLPKLDREANVYRPGWIGNMVVGGAAALVFWGLYGPLAKAELIAAAPVVQPSLKIAELCGSLLTGIGGGRLLTAELEKQVLKNQNDALVAARNTLAETITRLSGGRQ